MSLVTSFRKQISRPREVRSLAIAPKYSDTGSEIEKDTAELGRQLGQLLVEGIFDRVRTRKVYVVPHGILHYLPFQALPKANRYLIESLQNAQLALLRSTQWHHPYYWAGFQMIGSFR